MSKKRIIFSDNEKKKIICMLVKEGASLFEIHDFISFCEKRGLNPFFNEVKFIFNHALKVDGKQYIFYEVKPWGKLKFARYDDNFISAKAGVIYQGDLFEIDMFEGKLMHLLSDNSQAEIVGAWAIIETKDRGKFIEYANYNEYSLKLGKYISNYGRTSSEAIKNIALNNALDLSYPID